MEEKIHRLAGVTLSPWIFRATALIGKRRAIGGNMFRHQFSTLGILLDYKIVDPVLLKASLIHDLFEDAPDKPGVSQREIETIDTDGREVFQLVMEVTRRIIAGTPEPKKEYLLRIMRSGSRRAKLLKLADRISNLTDVGLGYAPHRVRQLISDTEQYVLPYAAGINIDMQREIVDLVEDRRCKLACMGDPAGKESCCGLCPHFDDDCPHQQAPSRL
jgi:GTP pyrophosphokinase